LADELRRVTVGEVLREIARDPVRTVVLGWNWKAALISAAIRAGIFFFTTLKAGAGSALKATLAEAIFAAVVAGAMGAVTQRLRNSTPAWVTGVIVSVGMPGILQLLQYWLHLALGTPHLKAGMVETFIYAAMAMLFNWFAMRRGTMLTAGEGRPLWRDLIEMPKLVGLFLMALPMMIWKRTNEETSQAEAE
jgi:hypothetical protein